MAVRFADTLKIAASDDLGVQVTLFDWWGLYKQIAQSQEWLRAFLGPYASNPEIQLVELKNEVNPSDPTEIAWVRALLGTLRSVMPYTPSTVSISGAEPPAAFVQLRRELAGALRDVADLHFYGDEVTAYSWMLAAKHAAGPLPLFIGEIGCPSADNGPGGPEAAVFRQAHWFSVVFAAARAAWRHHSCAMDTLRFQTWFYPKGRSKTLALITMACTLGKASGGRPPGLSDKPLPAECSTFQILPSVWADRIICRWSGHHIFPA